ncbi:MAG TPA: hypothetical protein VFH80_22135 [Solirubrobacteraceae bacterium]|nr:hypothetical protein [Solirubrobacteraceae bacterium]
MGRVRAARWLGYTAGSVGWSGARRDADLDGRHGCIRLRRRDLGGEYAWCARARLRLLDGRRWWGLAGGLGVPVDRSLALVDRLRSELGSRRGCARGRSDPSPLRHDRWREGGRKAFESTRTTTPWRGVAGGIGHLGQQGGKLLW